MNETKYVVVRKGNGKFAPRKESCNGSVWFNAPYEYDTLQEAALALASVKQEDEKRKQIFKEEVVLVLQ